MLFKRRSNNITFSLSMFLCLAIFILLILTISVYAIQAFLQYPFSSYKKITQYVHDNYTLKHGLPTYVWGNYKHSGTDYDVPLGTPIYASADGKVVKVIDGFGDGCKARDKDGGGFGNHVIVKHPNGYHIIYAHMQRGSKKISEGDSVRVGDIIGSVGSSGRSRGRDECGKFEHLHFEVRTQRYGHHVNPYNKDTGCLWLGGCDPGTEQLPGQSLEPQTLHFEGLRPEDTQTRKLIPTLNAHKVRNPDGTEAYDISPRITKLAVTDLNYSLVDGLWVETKKRDKNVPFYAGWHTDEKSLKNQEVMSLSKYIGHYGEISDMASGRFLGGPEKYLVVLYKGQTRIYFYKTNPPMFLGYLDPYPGIWKPSRKMHITTGDVDKDGRDELLVSHPRYDHIRMFDDFHYSSKGWTMRWIPGELNAHYGQIPIITDIVCMDIDSNGYDELLIATASDDHIFEYFYTRERGKIRFIKQGYIDGLEKYNPQTKAMTVMKFNGPGGMRDYLAVITQGASSKYVFFYWKRDLNHAWGGLFSRKGILKSPYNEILEDLTAGNFDSYLGDELALGTKHNDLVYFYGTWDLWKEGVWGGKVLGTQDVNLYNAKLIAQSDKKILLLPNQEKELWIEYQNQGAATWFTSDYRTPNLITDKPLQRRSLFKSLSWNSSYKPTTLANQVKPGQKVKYLFEIRVPKASKKYKEHFALYNNEKNDLYKNSKVSFEVVVDGVPPSKPKSLRPDIKHSFWAGNATSDITPTFIWEKSKDDLTEVISYLITLDNRTYAIKETKASTPKFTCPKLSEGKHTIIVQAQDKLGNLSDPTSYTFIIDVTPPEIPQNLGPDTSKSHWVDLGTSDTEPTFIWEKSSDPLTGVSAYLITLDDRSYSLDFSETSWVCPDLEEGNHTLTLKAEDKVNNISDAVSYIFIVDTSDPEPPENLEPETRDSQWYANITSDTTPTFKWQAGSDAYSGLDGYNIQIDSNSQYPISNIQFWTVPIELPEGEHTIYLASRDKLEHISDYISYSFIIDTSSSEGSIVIDSDDQFTNSQDVTLTIEASDVSPIIEYSISNDNVNWTDYKLTTFDNQLTTEIPWILPLPDGTKTVYIKFKDVFGHQSQAFSDSIILDQTNPSSYINDLPTFHNTLSFFVSWFGLDNLSGIKWFDVQVKDSLTNVWRNWLTGTSLISKIFQGIDGVTYWFRSRVQDVAGNREEYPEEPDTETTVDTTAPDPPTIDSPERNAILNATYDANLDMEGIQVEVAGTAEEYTDIQLTINPESDGAGSQQLTTKADQDGNWSISDVTLSEGENKLEAKSTDAAENWNTSGEHIVWLDTIAPSIISDLAVVDVTYHSLTFSWTAPGDDEDQGTAKEYDIRYSTLDISKDNFESATQVSSPPVPEEAGTVQTLTLDDLEPKQTYFIAIKTKDDGQNWSEISNLASDKTKTSADRAEIISTNPSDSTLVANGTLTLTITIAVYDPEGNSGEKLSGEPLKAEISDTNGESNTGNLGAIQDNGDGTYTLVYTAGKKVGDGKITIKIWDDQAEREMTKRETSLDVTLIPGDPGKAIALVVSPNSIKANGSDISTVTSGNITDANGNTVADGQKITIWLDNTEAGYIITQDQDPNISGIQVKVSSGKISFKIKSKVWNGYGVASKIANAKAKSVKGSASGSAQITFKDITPPSAPSITQPGNGIITNNRNVTMAGKSEKKSRVLLYKNNSYWYYRYADSNGNWSWTKSMGDGTYTLKAGARDTAGNPGSISSWSNSRTFTVDTQKPTITLSPLSPDPNNDSTPRFTGQASDSRTKIIDIEYKIDSGSWKNVPSFTPAKNVSFAFTLNLGDGGHTVYVKCKDQAGNWSGQTSDWFTIDTQKPTITLNALSDPNNDNTPKFTGKATDSRTKIVQIQYKVDSSSWRNISFSQSTNVSFSFTTFGLSDGGHTVYVRSKDQAGNWSSQASDSFTIDTKKPTIYGFSPANNVTLYHRTVTISANYSDDRSGINTSTAKMKIKVDSGSWQDVTSSCTKTSSKISYTKKWTQENHTYTVYVEVKDKAGNVQSATWSFKIQVVSRYKSKRDSNHRVWRIQPWDYPNVGQVTEPLAPTNWNSLNFNDSAWGLPYDLGSCGWISGAKWLWNDNHPDISETMLLRFTFNLPNVPGLKVADATIKIAIDDATWAYVSGSANEQLFAQQTMGQNPHSYWIKPHLKPGKNVIAFQVSNLNYDTGFINAGLGYEMKVVYEDGG